jgi:hypothetical protein
VYLAGCSVNVLDPSTLVLHTPCNNLEDFVLSLVTTERVDSRGEREKEKEKVYITALAKDIQGFIHAANREIQKVQ